MDMEEQASHASSEERGILQEISNVDDQNNQASQSKSFGNELLAITGNAVKSLKGYSTGTSQHYESLHVLSPSDMRSHDIDLTMASSNSLKRTTSFPSTSHNMSISSINSDHSQHTTHSGHSGRSSNSSIISANAKRVKISAKKLREIRSPFDRSTESEPSHQEQNNESRDTIGADGDKMDVGVDVDVHNVAMSESFIVEKHLEGSGSDNNQTMAEVVRRPPPETGTLSDSAGNADKTQARFTADSGYITEKVKLDTKASNATQEDFPSIEDEEAYGKTIGKRRTT